MYFPLRTKTVTRFRTPFIERCFQTLCQYREHHSNACKEAWLKFLASFASNCDKYSIVVRQLGTLDCLISLAEVAEQQGYTRCEYLFISWVFFSVCTLLSQLPLCFMPCGELYSKNNRQKCFVSSNKGARNVLKKLLLLYCFGFDVIHCSPWRSSLQTWSFWQNW